MQKHPDFYPLCYRKFEVYPMGWDLNFDNICLAAAQYGGPIAVIRDKKKFVRVQGAGKPTILIYSSSGHLISSVLVRTNEDQAERNIT